MQLAHILLSLGGDAGNTVPKSAVTPSEVAVLRIIHGEESVKEIEPYGQVERTSRQERQRLVERYGRSVEGRTTAQAVEMLFPGVAARLFEDFSELELPEEFYKPASRVSDAGATPAERREAEQSREAPVIGKEVVHPLDHDGDGKKGGAKKRAKKADAEPGDAAQQEAAPVGGATEAQSEEPEDGIEDMPDADMFK
jgi:hypothetical protein